MNYGVFMVFSKIGFIHMILVLMCLYTFIGCVQGSTDKRVKTAYASFTEHSDTGSNGYKVEDLLEYSTEGRLVKSMHKLHWSDSTFHLVEILYDSMDRPVRSQAHNNEKLVSYTELSYNSHGDLSYEYKIEAMNHRRDTVRLKYYYDYMPIGYPYEGYMINDGDTVTKYTVLETDTLIVVREEPFIDQGYTWFKVTERHIGQMKKPLLINTYEISSGYADRAKLDTVFSMEKFEYDSNGRTLSEEYWGKGKFVGKVQYVFENGGLKRKISNYSGVETETNYSHTYFE